MQHAPLHELVKKHLWPMVILFLQCSKKHSMEHEICPQSNGTK